MEFLFLIFFGYLVGSVSPGYFFGRALKGIDIRKYGSGQTGATNVYRTIGPVFGVLAAAIDAFKASFVYYVAVSGFWFLPFQALSPDLAILPGLAAVLGHNFPFYLNFRGGRGVAALFGLNLIAIYYTRSFYVLLLLAGSLAYSVLISEEREKIYTAPIGRMLAKLSALVLPLGFIWLPKEITLAATTLLLVSLFFDIVRFSVPKVNRRYLELKKFAKGKEFKRLSGYSLFLISASLLFNFFPENIAVISLVFFIVGDILAPAGQLRYMPHQRIFGDKTIGGALVIFVFSLLAGLFLRELTPLALPLNLVIVGAMATAALDQFSFLLDDNILVPLGTAAALWILAFA